MTETQNTSAPQAPEQPANASAAPQFGMGDQLAYQAYANKNSKLLWGIFVLLLVMAAGVFFVLPSFVGKPDLSTRTAAPEPQSSINTAAAISPFEEAQRLRQREAAQNSLAALLALQEALEQKQVGRWAEVAFNAAIDLAKQGDDEYREQEFIAAQALYQQGQEQLQQITDNESQTYLDLVAQGNAALTSGKAKSAEDAFSLALLVNADGPEAVSGLDRSAVLDKVLALLEQGDQQKTAMDLEAAKASYQQAAQLDPEHPQPALALQQIALDIGQRDFAAAMSRGYAALQSNDAQAAERAFKQAQAMRPQATEVDSALQQAADQRSTQMVNRFMDAARKAEAEERWSTALEQWQAALGVDENLVVAEQGKQRTQNRRDLDVFFNTVIREPLRLVDETIYQQTQQLMIDIKQITDPGPRLLDQIAKTQVLLAQARVPVSVQLKSDGLTAVTVYRVGDLGKFADHAMELLPGEYVAIGIRDGYRDVRHEFTVPIGAAAPLVTVICNEAI